MPTRRPPGRGPSASQASLSHRLNHWNLAVVLFLAGLSRGAAAATAGASNSSAASPETALVYSDTEAYTKINTSAFDLQKREEYPEPEVELGRMLFFDPRLSRTGAVSCSRCHQPERAWTDGLARSRGADGRALARNAPSLFNLNRDIKKKFFWDGRAEHLQDAVLDAMQSRLEMNLEPRALTRTILALPEYARLYIEVFGLDGVTPGNTARAISAFVETQIKIGETPFDRFASDPAALDAAQRRGMILFAGKARCVLCHLGPYLSDDYYHNTGLQRDPAIDDPGRYAVEAQPRFWRAFKTPPLRDVALTAPYMHDGRFKTLEEVVDHYDRGGEDPEDRDPFIQPLHLSASEKADLVAFLKSLTAPLPAFKRPRLPAPFGEGFLARSAAWNLELVRRMQASLSSKDLEAFVRDARILRDNCRYVREIYPVFAPKAVDNASSCFLQAETLSQRERDLAAASGLSPGLDSVLQQLERTSRLCATASDVK